MRLSLGLLVLTTLLFAVCLGSAPHMHSRASSALSPHRTRRRRGRTMTLKDLPPVAHISAQSQRRCEKLQLECDVHPLLARLLRGEAHSAVCLGAVDERRNVTRVMRRLAVEEEEGLKGVLQRADALGKEQGLSVVAYLSLSSIKGKEGIPFTASQYLSGCAARRFAQHKDLFCVLSCVLDNASASVMLEAFQITDQAIQLYEKGQVLDPQPMLQPHQSPLGAQQRSRKLPVTKHAANAQPNSNHVFLKDAVFVEGKETKEVDAVLFSIPVPITATSESQNEEL